MRMQKGKHDGGQNKRWKKDFIMFVSYYILYMT